MSRPWRSRVVLLGYLLYLPVLAGFLLHTSPGGGWRLFGKYSPGYAAFLLAVLVPAVAMPWLGRALTSPMRLGRADGHGLVLAGRRKAAVVFALALVSLVVGVALAELALAAPDLLRRGPWRPPPVDHEPFFETMPPREGRCNSWGWIGPNTGPRKPPGVYRIFALGGSTTFLIDLKPAETFVGQLAQSLAAARPAWKLEVTNAAMDGHYTLHSLAKYATLIQDFEPDLVLVMHAINDAMQGEFQMASPAYRRAFERDYVQDCWMLEALADQAGATRPPRGLLGGSAVLRRLAGAVRECFLSDLREAQGWSPEAMRREAEERILWALPHFRRNLRTLGQLVMARGGQLVIASQPTRLREHLAVQEFIWRFPLEDSPPPWTSIPDIHAWVWVNAMRRYNAASREVAAELGAPFVDLEAAVPTDLEYFHLDGRDCVHMSAAGCALAGKALHEVILPLIPERPAP